MATQTMGCWCQRNSTINREGRAAWSSSCSRNAHDRNVLVRRAQSRIDQAALEEMTRDGADVHSRDQPGEGRLDSFLCSCNEWSDHRRR